MDLTKVIEALDRIEQTRDEAISQHLQPLVQKEFERVKKRKPALTGIIFGNGTYAFQGIENDMWKMVEIRDTLSGARGVYKLSCPKYMANLVHLCDMSLAYNVCLDDIGA